MVFRLETVEGSVVFDKDSKMEKSESMFGLCENRVDEK